MEDTQPFTKYKFAMPDGALPGSPSYFFADSMEEADQYIIYQMQRERVFQFSLSKLDYEWDERFGDFRKVKETLLQSNIPAVK